MTLFGKAAVSAALISLAATPLPAQRWKADVGINGGYSWFTSMLDGPAARFASGPLAGSQVSYWPFTRFGVRANVRYTASNVTANDLDGLDFSNDVKLWGGTIDLLYRIIQPAPEYSPWEFLPYVAVGLGAKGIRPPDDRFSCSGAGDPVPCAPFGASAQTIAIGSSTAAAGLAGLGADWRIARSWVIRTEISDQVFKPWVFTATRIAGSDVLNLPAGAENISSVVHELGGQIGVLYLFGLPRREQVAAALAPARAPAPASAPAPVLIEESITVCIIDVTAPGGIRTATASVLPQRGDTTVTINGQRLPLRSAVANVKVASRADWFIRGQPLTLTIGRERIEFVPTSTARVIEPRELAFLGIINDVPAYVDRNDVKHVIATLDELNRTRSGTDLGILLETRKELRANLARIEILYIPLQPTGCIFQAFQVMERIRKTTS